ncbi:hypothetical protein ACJJTC_005520 [Scirpophaga incertulas]
MYVFNRSFFQCAGSGACGFAAWALWEGAADAGSAEARAGLGALAAWGLALAVGALAALAGAARGGRARALGVGGALLGGCAAAAAAAALWGRAHAPRLRAQLQRRLEATVRHDYGTLPSHTHLLDAIQQGLECCGAKDMSDWQGSDWERAAGGAGGAGGPAPAAALDLSVRAAPQRYRVPPSCCRLCTVGVRSSQSVASVRWRPSVRRARAWCGARRARRARARAWARARRVGAGGGGGGAVSVFAAPCGPRVLAALERGARAPLAAGAALLAALAAAALLALAMAAVAAAAPDHKA